MKEPEEGGWFRGKMLRMGIGLSMMQVGQATSVLDRPMGIVQGGAAGAQEGVLPSYIRHRVEGRVESQGRSARSSGVD